VVGDIVTLTNQISEVYKMTKRSCKRERERERKDICDIMVDQYHQCHQPQCHISIIPDENCLVNFFIPFEALAPPQREVLSIMSLDFFQTKLLSF
jgi:hypothetical protein